MTQHPTAVPGTVKDAVPPHVPHRNTRRRGRVVARAMAQVLARVLVLIAALPAWRVALAADNPAATSASAALPSSADTPAANSAASAINATSGVSGSAATSAPAAATPGTIGTPSAIAPNTGRVVRFGNSAVYRNLIPSPMLEAQAASEFNEIVRGAAHSNRLYADSDPRVQRVRAFVDRLAPYAVKWSDRVKSWKWEVAVIRSTDIRMYCLPGGKIVIYSGLIERLGLNDNELGMMIGHEIAHALREHARDRLGRQQAAQLSTGTIPPLFGFADISSTPLGIGEQLLAMRYTPADETEADVIGSEIASRAGYDPRAVITLWRKIDARTRRTPNGFIWMHPYDAARVHDLMKRLPDMMPLYAKAIGKTVDQLPNYAGMGRFKKPKM